MSPPSTDGSVAALAISSRDTGTWERICNRTEMNPPEVIDVTSVGTTALGAVRREGGGLVCCDIIDRSIAARPAAFRGGNSRGLRRDPARRVRIERQVRIDERRRAATTTPSSAPATTTGVVMHANNPKLGVIVVDAQGRTLYTLTKNGEPVACTGQCASFWPPLCCPRARRRLREPA